MSSESIADMKPAAEVGVDQSLIRTRLRDFTRIEHVMSYIGE
jgi:hypothetical protein